MRKIVISLLLLMTFTAQAQHIEPGSYWYNGAIVYTAMPYQGGSVVMSATAEGEELEFMLVPEKNNLGTYHTTTGPNDGFMAHMEGLTMKHIQQDGLDVLCFYNTAGGLEKTMLKTDEWDSQPLNVEHWMHTVRGGYTMEDGTRVTIDWNKALVDGKYYSVEAVTFNGCVTGIIFFDGEGSPINGKYEVIYTKDGLHLYEVAFDDYGMWHRLPGDGIKLQECDPERGLYDFANQMMFYGNELYDYDKAMLRLMRNSILAHHGYVFQSKDLQDYFGNEAWYHPGTNNDDIKLSLIERLNIDIIKNREAKADSEQ
jgi:hypothetical protein